MAAAGGHDRPDHRRFRTLGQAGRAVRRSRGAASAPIRCRSPCRPISTARCFWTWPPRQSPPARSRWRFRAASRFRWAGSSTATASRPRDPNQLRPGGALLPLGGSEGYKGSGLAAIVEILCGLLTGLGFGIEPTGRHNDGCFIAVFKVAAFRPLAQFKQEVAEFAAYLKATPPSEGSRGVLYPGEIEHLREQERRANGIDVEDAPGRSCKSLAAGYGLTAELDLA